MKRFLTTALILGSFSTFGLVGCGEETKVKDEKEVTTPGGTATTSTETKIETKGENPPANPAGEAPAPAK